MKLYYHSRDRVHWENDHGIEYEWIRSRKHVYITTKEGVDEATPFRFTRIADVRKFAKITKDTPITKRRIEL